MRDRDDSIENRLPLLLRACFIDLCCCDKLVVQVTKCMKPVSYGPGPTGLNPSGPNPPANIVDLPFRANAVRTGVLARNDRPEYGATLRAALPGGGVR